MKRRWPRLDLARYWLTAFIDPVRLLGLAKIPRYLAHWRRYGRLAEPGALSWRDSYPCLTDWLPYTPFDPHYFYQAGWAARKLAKTRPARHVDIGSSITLIGVISAYAPTVFVDYRPLRASLTGLDNVAGDILALPFANGTIHSLSCLHVIEHIGLGRYGDRLDPQGSVKATGEIVRVLAPAGRLFFSTPVGRERVQFNAHRVFAPDTILSMFTGLELLNFAMVDDTRRFYPQATPEQAADCEYACGMFEFVKRL